MSINKISLLGVDFSNEPRDVVLKRVLEGGTLTIVTPNVDHVIRFSESQEYRSYVDRADLVINDSRVLSLIASFLFRLRLNCYPGSDLTADLLKTASQDKTFTIVGATPEDIQVVKSLFNLEIKHIEPSMGFADDPEEIEQIVSLCSSFQTDYYLLCVGSPRQEMLAVLLRERGICGTILCVGASILFLSGREKRAPKIIQALALEWFWRLINNPKRLGSRYLVRGMRIFGLVYSYMRSKN